MNCKTGRASAPFSCARRPHDTSTGLRLVRTCADRRAWKVVAIGSAARPRSRRRAQPTFALPIRATAALPSNEFKLLTFEIVFTTIRESTMPDPSTPTAKAADVLPALREHAGKAADDTVSSGAAAAQAVGKAAESAAQVLDTSLPMLAGYGRNAAQYTNQFADQLRDK